MKSADCESAGKELLISGSLVRAQQAEPNSRPSTIARTHSAAYRERCGISSVFLALLAGCSTVPKAELAWQTAHLVDVAQTVQIARSSCYHESDELTSRMIGENPSVGEALAWGVALAGAHYGVTRWLEAVEAPRWLQAGWQVLTIGNTAYFIKQNNDQGIKPWGTDC